MTDDRVRTLVETPDGDLEFQEYFVRLRCEPRVIGFRFLGLDAANPTVEALTALSEAAVIVLCPSNPFVSLDPILGVADLRDAVRGRPSRPVIGVSPIVGGRAIKGPAAKMFAELGLEVSARSVADHFRDLLTGFVIDNVDASEAKGIEALGLRVLVTDTVMKSDAGRARLAREVLAFAAGNP